ncbi:thioesterase superfamily protein [gamma proteobacterium HdN1]|nr:thioesterase superfamily protein [gamma proteobacterium HdN1]
MSSDPKNHSNPTFAWERPAPFLMNVQVDAQHIDRLGHANNTCYVQWMQEISWQHVETIGMGWAIQEQEGCAMAIVRTEIDYIASAYRGDALIMGTWITDSDARLRSSRAFELIRKSDRKTLLRAQCQYVCIDLKKGRPTKMPQSFIEAHQRAIDTWRNVSQL